MKAAKAFSRAVCLILSVMLMIGLISCELKFAEDEETQKTTFEELIENTFEELDETSDKDNSYIPQKETYILNIKSKKIHKTTCGTGDLISPENRRTYKGDVEDLFEQGYTLCGNCYR